MNRDYSCGWARADSRAATNSVKALSEPPGLVITSNVSARLLGVVLTPHLGQLVDFLTRFQPIKANLCLPSSPSTTGKHPGLSKLNYTRLLIARTRHQDIKTQEFKFSRLKNSRPRVQDTSSTLFILVGRLRDVARKAPKSADLRLEANL